MAAIVLEVTGPTLLSVAVQPGTLDLRSSTIVGVGPENRKIFEASVGPLQPRVVVPLAAGSYRLALAASAGAQVGQTRGDVTLRVDTVGSSLARPVVGAPLPLTCLRVQNNAEVSLGQPIAGGESLAAAVTFDCAQEARADVQSARASATSSAKATVAQNTLVVDLTSQLRSGPANLRTDQSSTVVLNLKTPGIAGTIQRVAIVPEVSGIAFTSLTLRTGTGDLFTVPLDGPTTLDLPGGATLETAVFTNGKGRLVLRVAPVTAP